MHHIKAEAAARCKCAYRQMVEPSAIFLPLRRMSPRSRPGIPQPAVEVDHNDRDRILSLLNQPFHTITHYRPLLQRCLPFLLAVWTFPPPCVVLTYPQHRRRTVRLSLNPFESNDPPPTLLLWEALTDRSPFRHTTSHALHFHVVLHNTPPVATLVFLLSMLSSMGSDCLRPRIQNLAYVLTRQCISGTLLCDHHNLQLPSQQMLLFTGPLRRCTTNGCTILHCAFPDVDDSFIDNTLVSHCLSLSQQLGFTTDTPA
ncbi:hypothetical protein EV401DRAFT_1958747 [Pisolithus croceorrhizus]|nr:hypothetical protein EV401DRAFT_1958747 [Pisolithus croceorrhizus]